MTFLLLGVMILSVATASSDNLFVDHLTDKVYQDCYEKDLHINKPYIVDTNTNKSVDLIKWPYNYQVLRRIIELFGNIEPFAFFQGTCDNKGVTISGADGCGILTCNGHKLDINQYTYFWDGIRISVPREEFKTTYGTNSPIIETHGEESPVTTGDNSPINQEENSIWIQLFWSKGTIAGAIIGFLLNALLVWWKNKNQNKKDKKFSKKKRKKSVKIKRKK